jgi:hypothetical protein
VFAIAIVGVADFFSTAVDIPWWLYAITIPVAYFAE